MKHCFLSSWVLIACCFICCSFISKPAVGQEVRTKNTSAEEEDVAEDNSQQLRVMSFNIRYGLAKDGNNSWPNRDSFVADVAKKFRPDLLGIQEAMGFQADYLKQQMPKWQYFGASRDANSQGEQCGIFVLSSRFEVLNDGQFWLSNTPDEKFSKSWDSSLPRIATWVHLKDKLTQKHIVYLNTHFDHRGAEARLKSAEIIRRFVDEQKADHFVIVTGDFNCGFESQPYNALLATDRLQDTWQKTKPTKAVNEGTFNGFQGKDNGARIDWVLCSPNFQVVDAAIDKTSRDGKYPSDHFPVTAVLK